MRPATKKHFNLPLQHIHVIHLWTFTRDANNHRVRLVCFCISSNMTTSNWPESVFWLTGLETRAVGHSDKWGEGIGGGRGCGEKYVLLGQMLPSNYINEVVRWLLRDTLSSRHTARAASAPRSSKWGSREGWQLGERGKARRGKFIYIAPLKHKAIHCASQKEEIQFFY